MNRQEDEGGGVCDQTPRERAIALMLEALDIADSIGDHAAAGHISMAIHALGGEAPPPPGY